MKAISHYGSTRGETQSLERQPLCTREITGRRRRDRTGACVLTFSNPGTEPMSHLTSVDREMVLASGLYLVESSWLMSSTWTFVECDHANVYVSTHSSILDYTVPVGGKKRSSHGVCPFFSPDSETVVRMCGYDITKRGPLNATHATLCCHYCHP